MDIDSEDQMSNKFESLTEDNEKDKTLACTPKFIIFITVGNLIFIGICIVIIYFISSNKVDNISSFMNDYIKDLNKIAITEKRIKHLVKTDKDDKYQPLVDIQKLLFNFTWEKLSAKDKTIVKTLDEKISKFLLPKDDKTYDNITESLVKILTQKEDYHIYQLLDESYLKSIMTNLEGDEKELNENKLKAVILYALINLPTQILYFSNNTEIQTEIQTEYTESAIGLLKDNKIEGIINNDMEIYDENNNYIYMVLGCDQTYEMDRINATKQPVNITNTGLRIESTNEELKYTFNDSLKNYYVNPEYEELMKECAFNMNNENYNNFIDKLNNSNFDPNNYKKEELDEINEIFNNYTFSVETANTVINYLKLNFSPEQIHIIQLGGEFRFNLIEYNKSDAFILYNVYDISKSGDSGIKRATTEANVKAIKYLKNNYTNFLNDEQLKKIILVSTQGDAERQLEAFNIISNLYDISIDFNGVIWNTEKQIDAFDDNAFYSWVLKAIIKSYDLYSENYLSQKLDNVNDEIHKFAEDIRNLIENYK